MARDLHQKADLPFFEIYVNTPLEECEKRDVKGLYKKARAGKIKGFTGIDQPYEAPDNPELSLKTVNRTIGETVLEVIELLEKNGIIPRAANDKVGTKLVIPPPLMCHSYTYLDSFLLDHRAICTRIRIGGEKEGGRDPQVRRDLKTIPSVAAGPCRGMGVAVER